MGGIRPEYFVPPIVLWVLPAASLSGFITQPIVTVMSFLLLMTMLAPLFILAGVVVDMSRCPNDQNAGGGCPD